MDKHSTCRSPLSKPDSLQAKITHGSQPHGMSSWFHCQESILKEMAERVAVLPCCSSVCTKEQSPLRSHLPTGGCSIGMC